EEAKEFADKVLDRYRNPFVEHHWLSITVQYSSKMNMRNVALIERYILRFGQPSPLMAIGLAAHILFLRTVQENDGKFYGTINNKKYLVTDDNAAKYHQAWKQEDPATVVTTLLSDQELW